MNRRAGLTILLLVVLAGGGWLFWRATRPAPDLGWQGYAEADFVKIGPTQAGLLTALHVARGDAVAAGAALFDQDDAGDRAARDQAAQALAQAQAQQENLQQGSKPSEIAQAVANLADARATQTRADSEYARGQALFPSGAVDRQTLDQLHATDLSAQAKVAAMQAALDQARAPLGRPGELQAQIAAVAAARAALAEADWKLSQRHVSAPAAGRIADVLARPGEVLAAAAPVISLLPPGNIFVRFFIPEAALAGVHLGDHVGFSCDGCAADLAGAVSFIAPQAEYTPPLIYSEASQSKLVFMIEARSPPDQAARLNPGEPVIVRKIP